MIFKIKNYHDPVKEEGIEEKACSCVSGEWGKVSLLYTVLYTVGSLTS